MDKDRACAFVEALDLYQWSSGPCPWGNLVHLLSLGFFKNQF